MRSGGDIHSLPLVGKGMQSDKGLEAGSGLRAAHWLCLACCVSYYMSRPQGLQSVWQIISGVWKTPKTKQMPLPCLNIHIRLRTKRPKATRVMRKYACISITPQAVSELHFNLGIIIGVHLMPGVFLAVCALNLNPGSPPCDANYVGSLCSSPAERKQKQGEKALMKSLPTDVISNLRPALFSVNHP